MPGGLDLGSLQAWMQAVIMHPDGAAAGLTAATGADRDDVNADVDEVIASSSRLSAIEHIELYNRGYHLRLRECLRQAYPALRLYVGDELFDAFALDYLHDQPSRSYTLTDLCDGFADYLAASRPDADGPREPWVQLLVELAEIERLFARVYNGPGVETDGRDEDPVSRDAPTDRWDERVTPVPSLCLAAFAFPMRTFYLQLRRGEVPPPPTGSPTYLALSRRNYVVTMIDLSAGEYRSLRSLEKGRSLHEAAADGGFPREQISDHVRRWVDLGLVRAQGPLSTDDSFQLATSRGDTG
jgi:hypothetical protein